MKQIIIFLLLVIISIMGYNLYKKHKRFTPPEYEYKINDQVDLNYHDQPFLYNYYEAVEVLNGFVISQWSNNEIDVRNPGDDDEVTKAATSEYAKKLAKVKFYEDQLIKSSSLKNDGYSNDDVKMLERKGLSKEAYAKLLNDKKEKLNNDLLKELFQREFSGRSIGLGEQGSIVYEVQKILVKKGFEMPVDGIFQTATFDALKSFEEKNNLYPDGKLDMVTLEYLLR